MVNGTTKTAFLFPGQGAQYPGMALDFLDASSQYAKALFAMASDAMGRNIEALLRDSDADTLKRSDIAQPAITLTNLCAATFLRERGIEPAAAAGHSLGEYAALMAAGVIGPEDCLKLVSARGKAMQETVENLIRRNGGGTESAPGMAAVIGMVPEQVEALVNQWTAAGLEGLYTANFNSNRQVVVAGTAAALAAAEGKFKEAGAKRVLRLQVAGPFHSPFMAEAADKFGPTLESVSFKDPRIALFSNVTGQTVSSGIEARSLALRQITSPVRWTSEENAIASLGVAALLETGPGKALQGFWKDTGSGSPCYAAGTVEDIKTLFTN
jgi:[acyl-carrier-protein] S-malonyltransferase